MKRNLLYSIVLLLIVSCISCLVACSFSFDFVDTSIEIEFDSFTYTGEPIEYTITCAMDEYTVKWYIASGDEEDPTLEEIDYIPIEPGRYAVYLFCGDEENHTSITNCFEILKITPTVTVTRDLTKVYDGEVVSEPEYTTTNTESPTATFYYASKSDYIWSTTAPSTVGQYVVKVVTSETDHYLEAEGIAQFEITYSAV